MHSISLNRIYWKRRKIAMLSDEIKKVQIDEQKLTQIKKLIISAERNNIKTGEYTTQDMVKALGRIIEKTVD